MLTVPSCRLTRLQRQVSVIISKVNRLSFQKVQLNAVKNSVYLFSQSYCSSEHYKSESVETKVFKTPLFQQNFISKSKTPTRALLNAVRIDRVPLSANHGDIELLCASLEKKPQWICRLILDRISPYATWCIVFDSEEASLEAEQSLKKQTIAGSGIHCFRLSTTAVERAVASTSFSVDERPRVLILSNIPNPLSEYHILQLFHDYQVERIIPSRSNASFYLVFSSFDEACRALREKQNEYLGWKKILLTPVV
eukprot:jgi/Galph1/1303/GphlegSOOS_G6082.1